MKQISVSYTCRVCRNPGTVLMDPPEGELAQRMFDAVFPSLSHDRCARWRWSNTYATEDVARLSDCYAAQKPSDREKTRAALYALLTRWMRNNTSFLGLSSRPIDSLLGDIVSNPRTESARLKAATLELIGEAQSADAF